jgi:WD40 repeat protein
MVVGFGRQAPGRQTSPTELAVEEVRLAIFSEETTRQTLNPLSFNVDPTQRRIAWLETVNGKQRVVLNEERQPLLDKIESIYPHETVSGPPGGFNLNAALFSPDGSRVAFKGRRDEAFVLYVDGKQIESSRWDISPWFAGKSRLVYTVEGPVENAPEKAALGSMNVIEGLIRKRSFQWASYVSFSPDGRRYVEYGMGSDDKMNIAIDGKRQGSTDVDTTLPMVFWSSDCKSVAYFAYPTREYEACVLVIDGNRRKAIREHWEKYLSPQLVLTGPSNWAYVARDIEEERKDQKRSGQCIRVIHNGRKGKIYDEVYGLVMSPDGSRIAYRTENWKGGSCVVVDGIESKKYEYVTDPVFSPDGKHVVYSTSDEKLGSDVVLDGVGGRKHASGRSPVLFSPNSQRLAYFASGDDSSTNLVIEGEQPCQFNMGKDYYYYDRAKERVFFSPDSRHVAYFVHHPRLSRVAIAIDGKQSDWYDTRPKGSVLFWEDNNTVRTVLIRGNEALQVKARLATKLL